VLAHASALLAFWSGAICLGRGTLWIFFVLSVSYVSQHCSIVQSVHVVQCAWWVLTYVAGGHWLIAVWNLQPCMRACKNPPLLPLLYAYAKMQRCKDAKMQRCKDAKLQLCGILSAWTFGLLLLWFWHWTNWLHSYHIHAHNGRGVSRQPLSVPACMYVAAPPCCLSYALYIFLILDISAVWTLGTNPLAIWHFPRVYMCRFEDSWSHAQHTCHIACQYTCHKVYLGASQ
jgi:hypothetical protein